MFECRATGRWSHPTPPTCLPKSCGALNSPGNGVVNGEFVQICQLPALGIGGQTEIALMPFISNQLQVKAISKRCLNYFKWM